MTHAMTLPLRDDTHETVKHLARTERLSMNTRIDKLVEHEDMRRRCAAHDRWMRDNPQVGCRA